jgi:hypothetical protein
VKGAVVAECVFQVPTRELADTVERIESVRDPVPKARRSISRPRAAR